jgi:hypothetical protein
MIVNCSDFLAPNAPSQFRLGNRLPQILFYVHLTPPDVQVVHRVSSSFHCNKTVILICPGFQWPRDQSDSMSTNDRMGQHVDGLVFGVNIFCNHFNNLDGNAYNINPR